jgi:NADH-ubiquinone oxidoreductase chain 5
LFQLSSHIFFFEAEFLSFQVKLIPFIFSLLGILFAYYVYFFISLITSKLSFFFKFFFIYSFFIKKWYFDIIYNNYIANKLLIFGYNISFKILDRGLIELIGPLGIVRATRVISQKISLLQSGLIYHYAFTMIIGLTFFILLFVLSTFLKVGLLVFFGYIYIFTNLIKNN